MCKNVRALKKVKGFSYIYIYIYMIDLANLELNYQCLSLRLR